MELLLQGSAEAMEKIEERTTQLEERLVNGEIMPEINREIFRMRNELTAQKHYYEQLIDIGEELQQNANNVFENSDLRYLKIFTVVTTIFLPLTLIVGWYGMNFKNMPELYWKYGYAGVIALSIFVVAGCILFFKRKKFM